jgi:hypothetical protein
MKKASLQFQSRAKKALILFISFAFIILSSCKKDGGASTTSRATLLTGGKWTLQKSETQQKDGSWVADPTSSYVTTIEFHDDKTFTAMTGGSTGIGTWRLSDDNSQLVLANTGGTVRTYDLLQLTSVIFQFTPAGYSPTDYMHKRDTYVR